jgi:hypothetical protein
MRLPDRALPVDGTPGVSFAFGAASLHSTRSPIIRNCADLSAAFGLYLGCFFIAPDRRCGFGIWIPAGGQENAAEQKESWNKTNPCDPEPAQETRRRMRLIHAVTTARHRLSSVSRKSARRA